MIKTKGISVFRLPNPNVFPVHIFAGVKNSHRFMVGGKFINLTKCTNFSDSLLQVGMS